jgi:uncharacterized membrane protein YgcG
MKLFTGRFAWFAIACLLSFAGLAVSWRPVVSAQAVDNFTIEHYSIDLYVGEDTGGHSTLRTVEQISANFPDTDQNHGIERTIPTTYDNHPAKLHIGSVTDELGTPLHYSTRSENGNEVVRIGDADTYVHGLHTYKLSYYQTDVTKYFQDTNDDEFYWDTNGTDWAVPIADFTANVHFDTHVQSKLSGRRACYQGAAGAAATCNMTETSDGITTHADNLAPGENITVALGFPPHTFAIYKPTLKERLKAYATVMAALSFPLGAIAVLLLVLRYYRLSMRSREHTTIVPEYTPPQDTSVTVSATIYRKQQTAFAAQLIDFSVRHYTNIYQTREKTLFRPASYEIEIIKDISDLHDEEQEIFRDIFTTTSVGSRLDMASLRNNMSVSMKVSDNALKIDKNIKGKYGLRARDPQATTWFRRAALVLLILAIPLLSFWVAGAALVSFIMSLNISPLTDKGLALYHYLEGLKLYIKTAETDRIRMLQSPDGAEKTGESVNPNDPRQLIKLYERVLPYAILFGEEKQWNQTLGRYYESLQTQPDWYHGQATVFNAASFSSAISSFNTAAYSSAASSSSGGSSGGGSSGGGGGGGGGGGW